jgi:hypothetical protein
MKGSGQTFIFCLDDYRSFSEDLKKRFSDPNKYRFISSDSYSDIMMQFRNTGKRCACKVVVINIYESNDQSSKVEELTRDLRQINQATGLILVYSPEKSEEIKKTFVFNIDAYIPRNGNTIPRIHNAIKKIVSEYNFKASRKRFNLSLYVLIAFLILSGILLFILYLIPSGIQ